MSAKRTRTSGRHRRLSWKRSCAPTLGGISQIYRHAMAARSVAVMNRRLPPGSRTQPARELLTLRLKIPGRYASRLAAGRPPVVPDIEVSWSGAALIARGSLRYSSAAAASGADPGP
jgi:hypothetical protein